MNKQKIPKEDGGLKERCNNAFYAVQEHLPERIRENVIYNQLLGFGLGFGAGYIAAESGEEILELLNIDPEKFAKVGFGAAVGTPVFSRLIAPRYFKQFIKENPIYSPGVLGVMAGASLKSLDYILP
jgi:hypothetical protein